MTERRQWLRVGGRLAALSFLGAASLSCAGTTRFESGEGGAGGTTTGSGGVTGGGGTGGVTSTCTVETEICDGVDNDCDGQIDNVASPGGCACKDGDTQVCYSGAAGTDGVGECKKGEQACSNGAWGECAGQVTPEKEACDGKDNDCNGQVDDGIAALTCGVGECAVTQPACVGGAPQQCIPNQPTQEVCDGKDNNCNQLVDESDPMLGLGCMTGGGGVCAQGKYQCNAGVLECVGSTPSAEVCDGVDNDCNGIVDDAPGTGGNCSTGLPGVCSSGLISCEQVGGVYQIDCFPITAASPEVCDGLDNNCNGQNDEGDPGGGAACNTGSPGICGPGVLHCKSGAVSCVGNAMAQPESCDGLDNNCNGQVDEGNPGGGAGCSTGLPGKCGAGTTSCSNGAIACIQTVQPSAETCNLVDDNCNGQVDEGNPGGGAACSTGLLGVCSAGTVTCQSGQLACAQNAQPSAEICGNAVDENCDGTAPAAPTTYFNETFANNAAGWTLGTEWAIGPAVMSACGGGITGEDPSTDHTPTADNGVAGVIIGGCYSPALHPDFCITSPNINLSGVAGNAYLSYFRHLHSDYPSFITNHVDVSADGGTTWTTLFTSPPGMFINDSTWTAFNHNITAQKSATTRVRFCYSAGSSGIFIGGGWSVDDVQITDVICQ